MINARIKNCKQKRYELKDKIKQTHSYRERCKTSHEVNTYDIKIKASLKRTDMFNFKGQFNNSAIVSGRGSSTTSNHVPIRVMVMC
jgi:hypothetical protein